MDLLQVLTYLVWLVGSVTFILALKFLASPSTARRGNQLGAAGMALIILWTFFTVDGMLANWWILAVGGLVGGVIGVLGARRTPVPHVAPTGSDASISDHTLSLTGWSY